MITIIGKKKSKNKINFFATIVTCSTTSNLLDDFAESKRSW